MSETFLTSLEPWHRVKLPAEWAEALGFGDQVALDRLGSGILIHPVRESLTWDDVFADKLPIGPVGLAAADEENVEVEPDDLLF